MRYRPLGKTGLEVSVVGLGCAQLGSPNIEYGVRLVQRALELGINYLDTARGYRDAEIKIGLALQGQREKAILSTKTGAKTRDEAWRQIEESLQRLQTDYVDNCHLHGVRPGADLEQRLGPLGALEALIEARDQGLVRHIGITSHTSPTLIEALRRFPFEVLLVPMNLVEREPLDELLPLCQARGVGVTIMKPIATGLLPARLALKWLLNQPIACAVPGVTTLTELEENALVGHLPDFALSSAEQKQVHTLQEYWAHRRCHVCYQCMPCEKNINIGITLGTDVMYDHYRTLGREAFVRYPWSRAAIEKDLADRELRLAAILACDQCRDCEARCPHGLPIVDMLRSVVPIMQDMLAIHREWLQSA